MEYKAYIEFLKDENLHEFKTSLPIQLDATCNGIQHMAMLSNEQVLIDKLNLKESRLSIEDLDSSLKNASKSLDEPEDFYGFILHKLVQKFTKKIESGEIIDENIRMSYKRLSEFVWDRKYIKKTLMTIPYNASIQSMKSYLLGELVYKEVKDQVSWYSDAVNSNITINHEDVNILVSDIVDIIYGDSEKS